jgi:hypothetical protein
MVVDQFLTMSKAIGSIKALQKTKLNKMIQTKKHEWTKQIQGLIKHIKVGLLVLFILVST